MKTCFPTHSSANEGGGKFKALNRCFLHSLCLLPLTSLVFLLVMPEKKPDVSLQVPAELHYLPAIGQFTKTLFLHHPLLKGMENLIFNLELVISEACSNVVRHAYPDQIPGPLEIRIWLTQTRVIVQIIDYGHGFDPQKVPTPDFEEPREGGMGLYIIRESTDYFQYIQNKKANTMHLEFDL
mgnify:CR=1 FL=1